MDDAGTETKKPQRIESWLISRGVLLERGPRRIIAGASFVNMLGTATFNLAAAIFYTQVVGLSVGEVGLAMGIGAVVGVTAGIPVGRLADRRGPRGVYLCTLCLQGVAAAALVLVQSFWMLALLLSLGALAQSASVAARGPIVRRYAGEKPARFRAYLRASVNLSYSLGALAAGLVIQLNTPAAYLGLILGNAASYFVTAAVISLLPSVEPKLKANEAAPRKDAGKKRTALRDYPFVTVTALDGIMSIQGKVLSFALPLWIVGHTSAPRWFVGLSVLINTIMVITLQVRASKGVETNSGAAKVWRRSGWAFLAGMTLIGLTGWVTLWAAVVLILIGVIIHTVGELWQAAGSFELRYSLAPASAQGEYSGVFQMGGSLTSVVAPSVLGFFCITWGSPGWVVLGGIFALLGLAMPPVVRWADRTRPSEMSVAGTA